MGERKRKVCFAASSGGHLDELLMLRPLMERYDSFIVTERTAYQAAAGNIRRHYLLQLNRREKTCIFKLAANALLSIKIYCMERPDVVVCTGVLATVPLCLLCKAMGKKLVFIETFAKVETPTATGTLLYRFADRFYIQWPELRKYYPKAEYCGAIY